MNSQRDAILLLTVSLGGTANKDVRPLSPKEWARFASWLHERDLTPESLINADLDAILTGWIDPKINKLRLEKLLKRGAALGLALEKWSRAGLWVITRSDADYPKRLLKRLGKTSPPVLFGCGNEKLLNLGGISVVGSRNVSEEDARLAEELGCRAAGSGLSVVSGGARGVDQLAMFGSLNASGTVIGVMADSLLSSAMSKKYRQHIASGDLVLVSPFNPEARFNVGNAMGRNRYIYCLSDVAVVVCSTPEKGGTWNGAIENLEQKWVPLWVKKNNDTLSGNSFLQKRGADWFPENITNLNTLKPGCGLADMKANTSRSFETELNEAEKVKSVELDLYKVFLLHVAKLTKEQALAVDEIAKKLEVSKAQTNIWVKRGVEDKSLVKMTRPVRYKYQLNKLVMAELA